MQYPIGAFTYSELNPTPRKEAIAAMASAPNDLKSAVQGLNEQNALNPYRDGGWSIRQIVHHIPDSHLNSYVRLKLALTEDAPVIKPYDENRWSDLYDVHHAPLELSVHLLESLHGRWVLLLNSLRDADFKKTFVHPEHGKTFTLDYLLAYYAWHGAHHIAQVKSIRNAFTF
jgi:hypothetical protein